MRALVGQNQGYNCFFRVLKMKKAVIQTAHKYALGIVGRYMFDARKLKH
jgi:hypothetical protein